MPKKRVPPGLRIVAKHAPRYPVYLSSNTKTRYSLNTARYECSRAGVRTRLCSRICYAACPPLAWYEHVYARNSENIRRLVRGGHSFQLALAIAGRLQDRGLHNLRICGSGELFPELLEVLHALTYFDITPWGFSRNPDLISAMAVIAKTEPEGVLLPIFHGSIDKTTPEPHIRKLREATTALLGYPSLAYLCTEPGWVGRAEVEAHPHKDAIRVVFGQHGCGKRTHVWHPLECPATGGQAIHCHECRRCSTHRDAAA